MSLSSRKMLYVSAVAALLAFTLSDVSGAPNVAVGVVNSLVTDSVEVPVTFVNNASVVSLQFDVYYDPAQLSSGNLVAGDALGAHGLSSSLIAAGRRRIVISPSDNNGPLASGEVARLPFSVRADAAVASRLVAVGRVVMSNATAGNVLPDNISDGLIGDPGNASDDQDRDGMPDSWEIKYGLDPFDAADAVADANGNGVANLQEYRNGADPVKSLSTPGRLYLSDHGGSTGDVPRIIAIDPEAQTELAAIAMTDDPQSLVAHPDGSTLYAAVGTDLSVIDVQSNTEVNHLTAVTGSYEAVGLLEDLAISPDGRTLYLVYRKMPYPTLEIKAFDITTPARPVVKTVIDDGAFKGCYGPLGLGVKPGGSMLYVACRQIKPGTTDRFYIVDAASGAVNQTAAFARDRSNLTFINGITVSADGRRVYLVRTDSNGSTVEVFDGGTGEKAASIALPDNALPRRSVVSPDGSRLYVVDQRLGTHVIDTATNTVLMTMSNTRSRGVDIAVNGDGSRLYSASLFRVFVLDGDTNDWSSTITGDFGHVFQLALTPGR